jgi:hypothetical protein
LFSEIDEEQVAFWGGVLPLILVSLVFYLLSET